MGPGDHGGPDLARRDGTAVFIIGSVSREEDDRSLRRVTPRTAEAPTSNPLSDSLIESVRWRGNVAHAVRYSDLGAAHLSRSDGVLSNGVRWLAPRRR